MFPLGCWDGAVVGGVVVLGVWADAATTERPYAPAATAPATPTIAAIRRNGPVCFTCSDKAALLFVLADRN